MSVLLSAMREKNKKKRQHSKPAKKKNGKKSSKPTVAAGYIPNATTRVWNTTVNDVFVSVALQTDSLDIWVNDELAETSDNFSDDGAQLDFCIFDHKARIEITSSGKSGTGMKHVLTLDGVPIDEIKPPATT